jgi:hypothetical protein
LLCSLLHSPVTSSLLGPNILLSTLFSNPSFSRKALFWFPVMRSATNFAINYKEPRPVIYTHTHALSLSLWCNSPTRPGPPHSRGFNITPTMTQHSRRNLYQTKHNTHKDRPLISAAGFEPATPASKLPQTFALDHSGLWYRRVSTLPIPYPQRLFSCVFFPSSHRQPATPGQPLTAAVLETAIKETHCICDKSKVHPRTGHEGPEGE